jgi:hypothetical protein
MKALFARLKSLIQKRPQAWIGLLIFCTCAFVYWANGETISSTDNVSSSLLGFHWLDSHSFNFDDFRNGYMYRTDNKHGANGIPHFFVEAPNGHLSSTYPIGNVILTFPVYFLFFVGIKIAEFYQLVIQGNTVDYLNLTDPSFEGAFQHYQKLAAIAVASFSTVIFYWANRLKFSAAVALVSTFIFAFATSTWMTGSQGLWQHGCSNLVVLCIIFCLLKANRTQGKNRKTLLFMTGVFCGLLPGVRSTSALYAVAAIAYALFAYRKEALYLFLGLPSALISASWNIYYFGFSFSKLFIGGYTRFGSETESFTTSYYSWTIQQFTEGFFGLLISPSRGLLVFTPVSLLALPGASQLWRWRTGKDEKLFLCLTLAAVLIFLQYCFFKIWTGGSCYGPRYMTDTLPIICFLISYCLAHWAEQWHQSKRWINLKLGILALLILCSTFPQVVGAFGSTSWDSIPPVSHGDRIWRWQDTQIQRHANHVFYKAFNPMGASNTEHRQKYLKNWNGEIESVSKRNGRSLDLVITGTPSRKMVLLAKVKNTGKVPWIGYETGLSKGLTQIGVEFVDSSNQPIKIKAGLRSRFYISGMPKPGETVEAIGQITFPPKPGDYKLVLELGVGGIKKPTDIAKPIYELQAHVVPES